MPTPDYTQIATALVGGTPLSFKPYPDGSLIVIAPSGQKHKFTPEQVLSVTPKLKPEKTRREEAKSNEASAKPEAKPTSKPRSPGRPKSTPKPPTKSN
jgi:hypothetical protein